MRKDPLDFAEYDRLEERIEDLEKEKEALLLENAELKARLDAMRTSAQHFARDLAEALHFARDLAKALHGTTEEARADGG